MTSPILIGCIYFKTSILASDCYHAYINETGIERVCVRVCVWMMPFTSGGTKKQARCLCTQSRWRPGIRNGGWRGLQSETVVQLRHTHAKSNWQWTSIIHMAYYFILHCGESPIKHKLGHTLIEIKIHLLYLPWLIHCYTRPCMSSSSLRYTNQWEKEERSKDDIGLKLIFFTLYRIEMTKRSKLW